MKTDEQLSEMLDEELAGLGYMLIVLREESGNVNADLIASCSPAQMFMALHEAMKILRGRLIGEQSTN